MNTSIVALVKRELWEHRALWLVPVGAAVFFILSAIFGGGDRLSGGIDFNPRPGVTADQMAVSSVGEMSLMVLAAFLTGFSGLAVFAYLLDCLYAERKDRSILFWKSLPVSDTKTVAAKLVVALVLVPALVLVLAVLLQPVMGAIAWIRFPELREYYGSFVSGLQAAPYLVVASVFGLLWYLPLATYLMLASVLAKRTPIMYAVIPPLALIIGENVLFETGGHPVFGVGHVQRFVLDRLFPWGSRVEHLLVDGAPGFKTVGGDWWVLFQDPKLWLGLVAAAGMMYLVVRLRRYRDDT
jgi:ABC-2 type transport system permease protein